MANEYIMYTGVKGAYDFDTEMQLQLLNEKELRYKYREHRNKIYSLNEELNKIKQNKIYKILNYFKLI